MVNFNCRILFVTFRCILPGNMVTWSVSNIVTHILQLETVYFLWLIIFSLTIETFRIQIIVKMCWNYHLRANFRVTFNKHISVPPYFFSPKVGMKKMIFKHLFKSTSSTNLLSLHKLSGWTHRKVKIIVNISLGAFIRVT